MTRAHDLVRLRRPAELSGSAPQWVSSALARAPWAVVRRSAVRDGQVPVGVRGPARDQRWAAVVTAVSIVERLTPEELVERVASLPLRTPASRTLAEVRHLLAPATMPWGPTGSAGFELATGLPTLRPQSDLDLVLRAHPQDLSTRWDLLTRLRHGFACLPAHVDAQLDLGIGTVALEELLSTVDEVLVRTPTGPALMPVVALLERR
ncbi:malonate decarboxylase holo-ACP synthase [Mycobacterium sp. 852002-51057_SCH5723018]|uniref:malonate decarboxylase holo-ACP synthase n=1 Tax=Mycobacterium sp. 852002-51057_SCH5723018 TaxID=1834094 RepID=UPI0018D346E2|nr:malonate decarboxylase holo-ACP synthase [Mycobacterium sp. 852002-51057_SCH5723018]